MKNEKKYQLIYLFYYFENYFSFSLLLKTIQ